MAAGQRYTPADRTRPDADPETTAPNRGRFHYEPRFYDPSHDEALKQKLRFKTNTRRGKQPAFIAVAVLLLLALYLYTKL